LLLDGPHDIEWLSVIQEHLNILEDLNAIFLSYSPPWLNTLPDDLNWWFTVDHFPDKKKATSLSLNSRMLFSSFALFGVLLESHELASIEEKKVLDIKKIIDMIKESQCLFFDFIRWMLCARYDQAFMSKVQKEIDNCGFNDEQEGFIWKWIRKEIDLVKIDEDSNSINND
jgi:hypothetical protein